LQEHVPLLLSDESLGFVCILADQAQTLVIVASSGAATCGSSSFNFSLGLVQGMSPSQSSVQVEHQTLLRMSPSQGAAIRVDAS
jgi:hypothetical protein